MSSSKEREKILEALFQTERWDLAGGDEMQWEFPVQEGAQVEVLVYLAEIYIDPTDGNGSNDGPRNFDYSVTNHQAAYSVMGR